ncbi:nicotinate-nucleotide--dimethylbenzimidazole phosphoribosyltransferase [Murimonas intestini]|uniref:Nicotinate-nucleotide--dimethylbenzimidazole phosphoribosyltransferase n=1 Tax=Murimonas intestini TaxID=1337051 RepID=A0AB73TAS2_9FIRM|nr:nicotinate-nucleotide--dimethylbenzimidazole phosphoribosyltransferase [Murimonas intestini]MCR1838753.1 nicotinate-nucleotide--dimethylbenzimidazole phosphoribosyltransferase [Murimonas intestini]MCR1864053.1 nicotinate-nucleotide--dimethylbenzimidazole phosphoribosyltransferase [Murimonas intestini]MCR1881663.1 nicotinate-nucleotide--dimethylbenzimidazole phosphoribosyltransferase [Murimonas intestini]
MTVEQAVSLVTAADEEAKKACKRRWDSIAKPLNSLGKLESYLIKIAGMTGTSAISLEKKALVVMCADNGVVEEGVTQTGQEVTAIVSENFLKEQATASIMCRETGTDIFPVDIGIAADTNIINKKIAYGTRNMTKGPAMTREEAEKAIMTGIEMVGELKEKGYKIIATGEMGIGNTTTSSAVVSVLTGLPVENVTGRGAGLSTEGLGRKINAISRAIKINRPDPEDGIDVLSKVGGFDLAGLAGVFLGGAVHKVPVVIDGFISAAAALAAVRICPKAREYMLASHVSKEPAAAMLLEKLELEAALHCDMCLGEGTGAVALMPLLNLACAVYNGMSTFQDINVEEYKPLA